MSRKRNKGLKMDEEFNMLENILEEQGEARRFKKEEGEKNSIDLRALESWMNEFLNGKRVAVTKERYDELRERYKEKYGEYPPAPKDEFLNGKMVAVTNEQMDELRERYKEMYGEYPPESNDEIYLCGCVHKAFTGLPR